MTDLEELFRPLVDDGARHREPVAEIEARARHHQRERQRRRARSRFAAGFVAVALIAATSGIVLAGRDTGTRRDVPRVTTTPTVPPGWKTYDYGLARLSIPPGWTAGTGCDQPRMLLMVDASNKGQGCFARGGTPNIDIQPIEPGFQFHPNDPPLSVNGIPYEVGAPSCMAGPPDASPCPVIVWVPRLDVVLSFIGIDEGPIVKTLTYSTYARVVQQPFGPTPALWQTVALGGYEARVPRAWSVVRETNYCGPVADTVFIEFAPNSSSECPPPGVLVAPPRDSAHFVRDDDVLPSPPFPPAGAVVVRHNGLRFARTPILGRVGNQVQFTVDAPHGRFEVTLTLGLDPAVARGILGSLKMPGS